MLKENYLNVLFQEILGKKVFQSCLTLSKVSEKIQFPCRFQEYGCMEMLSADENASRRNIIVCTCQCCVQLRKLDVSIQHRLFTIKLS